MRFVLSSLAFCGILASNLSAQTVVVNEDILFASVAVPAGDPCYRISLRLSNTLWIKYSHQQHAVSPFETTLAYPGTQLFVVQPGDILSESKIAAGEFPEIRFFVFQPKSVAVDSSTDGFHLGVAVLSEEFIDQLGWIHLRPLPNGELEMVENVMSYGTRGIVVGTTTVVPEPGTVVFMCCILSVSAAFRTRRR